MDTNIDKKVFKNFIERRKSQGFTESTINKETKILNKFELWISNNNINNFNLEIIELYMNQINCGKQAFNKTKCTLLKLYNFALTGNYDVVTKRNEILQINLKYNNYINDYVEVISQDFDKTTINNKKVFLKYFFIYIDEKGVNYPLGLEKYHITEFLNNCICKYSKAYFYKIAYFTREYLNYLFNNKLIKFNGNEIIPKLNACYSTQIPTTYSNDEIKRLLLSVDKTTKIGKRDYLILLLLSTYGIRIGDICNMKLNNFNLELNTLVFIQQKTKKLLDLPLFDEIKFALLDYLKNSRPSFESEYLFITCTKPYRNYDKRSLRDIVPKYLKIANIDTNGKKKGAHTLRHSLASNMLSNGSNIKEISDILGHNYINTSNQYLTIDIKKLQELCLELPKNYIKEGDFDE